MITIQMTIGQAALISEIIEGYLNANGAAFAFAVQENRKADALDFAYRDSQARAILLASNTAIQEATE